MRAVIINIEIQGISEENSDKIEASLKKEWRVNADDIVGFEDGDLSVRNHYANVNGSATKERIADEIFNLIKTEEPSETLGVVIGIAFVDEEEFQFGTSEEPYELEVEDNNEDGE